MLCTILPIAKAYAYCIRVLYYRILLKGIYAIAAVQPYGANTKLGYVCQTPWVKVKITGQFLFAPGTAFLLGMGTHPIACAKACAKAKTSFTVGCGVYVKHQRYGKVTGVQLVF